MIRIPTGVQSSLKMMSITSKALQQQQRCLSSGSGGRFLLNRLDRSTLPICSSPLIASSTAITSRRWFTNFTPMTPQEEQTEKERVSKLTPFLKEMELRDLNRQIAKLEMQRGINTGELYTWRGKFKYLARDYGVPLMVWYWTVWCGTLACSYGAIELGGVDALSLLAQVDGYTGWSLAQHVSKEVGTFGLALAINEVLEPLRLPVVIVTTKPVVNFFYPPKY